MPKRRLSGDLVPCGPANPPLQRHLYIIFDDWCAGYIIRKVDLQDQPPAPDDGVSAEAAATDATFGHSHTMRRRQRTPPVEFRVSAPRGLPVYFAAAFDTKILAVHPRSVAGGLVHLMAASNSFFPVLDVHAPSLMYGPQPKGRANPIYIPVSDLLFVLAAGSFEVLHAPPPHEPDYWEWSWSKLTKPPFKRKDVISYAVHPDGRTILVSTIGKGASSASTFTFDTAMDGADSEWKLMHGQWMLPFTGSGYFDCELGAWVGLSRDQESIGHLCCCYVVSDNPDAGDGQEDRAPKLCKEKIFSEDPAERHVGAALVYLGGGSNFCLVQCVSIKDDSASGEMNVCKMEDGTRRYLLRVSTFSLKYDDNGDLTTGESCRVWYYKVPIC